MILGNQVADLEIFRAKQDSFLARRQQQQETLKFRQEEQTRRLENIEKKDQIDRDRYLSQRRRDETRGIHRISRA